MYITNCDNPIAKKLFKSNINAKNNNTIAEPLKEPYKQDTHHQHSEWTNI